MTAHSTINTPGEIHETKQIAGATTSDAGKVVTPSASVTGAGVLRFLEIAEINGLTAALAGKQGTITPAAANADLVDDTSGTAGGTVAAIPDPADTPADADALRDDLVANALPAIRNAIASIIAEQNEIKAALRSTGILTP